jgi:hypothetical protein
LFDTTVLLLLSSPPLSPTSHAFPHKDTATPSSTTARTTTTMPPTRRQEGGRTLGPLLKRGQPTGLSMLLLPLALLLLLLLPALQVRVRSPGAVTVKAAGTFILRPASPFLPTSQAFSPSRLSSSSSASSPSLRRHLSLRMSASAAQGAPKVLCYGEALVDRLGPLGGDPATDLPVVRFFFFFVSPFPSPPFLPFIRPPSFFQNPAYPLISQPFSSFLLPPLAHS